MTRRYRGRMNGERYLANTNTREVHDLDNERIGCRIDEIKAHHEKPYVSHETARRDGYDNCDFCIGNSQR